MLFTVNGFASCPIPPSKVPTLQQYKCSRQQKEKEAELPFREDTGGVRRPSFEGGRLRGMEHPIGVLEHFM